MKKLTTICVMILVFAAAGLSAQNLRDNPDYKKGLEYQTLARQSYEEGDYDKSVEYSAEAQEYFQKAKDYADKMALRFTANSLKNRVADRLHYAEYIHAERDYPEEYSSAVASSKTADEAFFAEAYPVSISGYQATLEILKDLKPLVPEPASELAKADELRAVISEYSLAVLRPAETRRGDAAYDRGKALIGSDNAQAKAALNEAITNYQLAINEAIAFLAAKQRQLIAEAKTRADSVNAQVTAADKYAAAQASERSAEQNLLAGKWRQAWDDSGAAYKGYDECYTIAAASLKPEYYTVRLIPGRRDCLWRIAAYDFVYGDPWKWRLLYDANKNLFPDPKNPRIIVPGMRLRIPVLPGELRAGEYQPK
ncbi:MAG: hypothetical protein LBT68_05700 [Spirochaetales bacterium]|jgi:nucleoid-associated protein YgaU|nr:hypothetical protein [Spirochaetales bacterium]